MKGITLLLVAVAILAGIVAFTTPASLHAANSGDPIFVTTIPPGYRDWRLISVGPRRRQPEQSWRRFGQRCGDQGLPRGEASIPGRHDHCRLHYGHVPSAENNKVFGQAQSFVPGPPTNIQFMVKDSTKYAATGGWGFATFIDGKPAAAASMKGCFPCHNQAKASDLVFTHYAP
jgi:hypothetical protein